MSENFINKIRKIRDNPKEVTTLWTASPPTTTNGNKTMSESIQNFRFIIVEFAHPSRLDYGTNFFLKEHFTTGTKKVEVVAFSSRYLTLEGINDTTINLVTAPNIRLSKIYGFQRTN